MGFLQQANWKTLLAVFKIKRFFADWFGTRRLDYAPKNLRIVTKTLREYTTRAKSVAKEPATVAWIEREAKKRGVFYDVGANIGAYSLIAGTLGFDVLAFEPASYNTETLEENIALNKISRVRVLPVALGSQTKLGEFTVMDATSGSSRGFYNEAGEFHLSTEGAVTRTVMVLTMDACIELFGLPPPNLLKIDVDGGEIEVIEGAKRTLSSPVLRSVLIEAGEGRAETLCDIMISNGFLLTERVRLDARTENLIFTRP
jgi:FkbM family methyltransferase